MIKMFQYSIKAWVLVISAFLVQMEALPAFADDKEDFVKAAFMLNFMKFIEWPDGKALSKQSKIDICVVGDSGIVKTSQVFLKNNPSKVEMSLVSEQNIHNISTHCHILFISDSESVRLPEILSAIKGQPVLTVSDGTNFIDRGVMIGFTNDDNKMKIEVNKKAVENSGIRVDSQLLEIAFRVIDK